MPRDGSGIYSQPFPDVVEGTTIESAVYNGFTHDVEIDLNTPRPILAGGTGASSADEALDNLKAEKFKQVVTSWDTTVWRAGSFYAATTAIGIAPVAGHAFAGIVYYANATDLVIEATDLTDPINPTKYIRIMTSGVWGNWMLAGNAAASTGEYTFDNTLTFPPAAGQIRFDNATQNSATEIFISHTTALGLDNTGLITASIKSGYSLFIRDKDEPTKYKIFTTTATPVLSGSDFRVTVTFTSGGADIVTAQRVLITASTGSAVSYDIVQNLTETEKAQARKNIYAAPFDALAYNGMQINGLMEVSQERAYGATVASGYVNDGWTVGSSSAAVVAAQTSGTAGLLPGGINYHVNIAVTTAATPTTTQQNTISQQLEGYRISRLAWGTVNALPVTIGFWTAHHRTGPYSVAVRNSDDSRSYVTTYTQNAADTWEYKTVTIPGATTGTWKADNTIGMRLSFCQACGPTYTIAPNVWGSAIGVAATGQVNAVASTSDVFRITGVVVLPGTEAPSAARSALIMRPYDQELLTCQRYWHYVSDYFSSVTVATGGAKISHLYSYGTPMRSLPTAVRTSFTNVANTVSIDAGSIDVNKAEILLSPSNVNVLCTGTAVFTFDARLI